MTGADLHRLIDELPDEAVDGAALLIQRMVSGEIDLDQTWVWTPAWQRQLRASLGDLADRRLHRYESGKAFIDSLA